MNEEVLVTGGAGFLGSFIVERLHEARIARERQHSMRTAPRLFTNIFPPSSITWRIVSFISPTISDIVNSSLRTAAEGTGIVLAGSAIALLLGFVNKLLIIRNTTQAEFGIFSLALAVVSIASLLSTVGLQAGHEQAVTPPGYICAGKLLVVRDTGAFDKDC